MNTDRTLLTTILCSLLSIPLAAANDSPIFSGLGDLEGGTFQSIATGISADGSSVCGHSSSEESSSASPNAEAFRWRESDGIVGLGFFSFAQSYSVANALSTDGDITAGHAAQPGIGPVNAARWIEGTGITNLGVLAGASFGFSDGRGCSDDGLKVAGTSSSSNGNWAFLWVSNGGSGGVMSNLGVVEAGTISTASKAHGISGDGGVVVGSSTLEDGIEPDVPEDLPLITRTATEAFRWNTNDGIVGLGDLEGGSVASEAFAASFDGSLIVGYGTPSDEANEGVIWSNDRIMSVGDLEGGDINCRLLDLSADGSMAVGFGTDADGQAAVIWDDTYGLRKLSTVLSGLGHDLSGWTLTSAVGISADGDAIAGNGINPTGDQEAWRLTGASALFAAPATPAVTIDLGWVLRFSTEPGSNYQLEYSFDSAAWLPLGDVHSTIGASGASSHAVLDTTDSSLSKDYRITLLPGSISEPPTDLTRAQGAVIGFETQPGFLYQAEESERLVEWLDLGEVISTVGDTTGIKHTVFDPFQVFPGPVPPNSNYRIEILTP